MPSINLNLLPMKGHYFLFNAGTSPIVPFMPTLARQLGFSSVVVGSLYTALPIMGMLVKPTMGALADRYKCQKALFLAFILLTIASFFPLQFVPGLPVESAADFHCHQISDLKICGTDSCVADQLIAEGSGNTTIYCKMRCELGSGFLQTVCRDWNWSSLCEKSVPVLTILGDTRATTSPQSVAFNALLSPQHTLPLENSDCLFTRVSKVQLAGGDVWHTPYCNTSLQIAQCRMQCQSDTLSDLTNLSNSQVISHYQFWMFTSLLVFSWIGMAVVVSVGDAICFTILGDQPGKYGNQRMWGSVGFGLCVIVAGWLVDTWSAGMAHKDYTPVFYMMAVMLTLDFVVSSKIKYTQTPQAASILRNVGKMFKDIQVLVFLLWLVVVGMCTALIWNFLFWYLEELADNYGCSVTQQWIKTLEGLVNGVQCFGGEIPFFFLSGWILKKIGHTHAMSLVLFAFSIRFLLYSTLTNPWWCLPIEMLNGLTFGLLYATMASYASLVAPPGTDTTVQGLVGAIFEGIGVSMGSFLAGLMFDQMSGAMVFRISGLAVLVLCVLHICAQFFISRRHILVVASGKDFHHGAHYASPNEAIHMLDEPTYESFT
ncbi:major facilitator superfamily domain-containing protein 6 isoform X1 [Homalodisca vitripennis]|uniref:major facilitator superfamily domain-containing protein 6 isoform X1 n=1 Tax=Homalodisca vitripennis TaxID=197043 RepID=UPI001EEC4FE6|nr:major facilitator superfamily domain-containing protein 6 isoform X1 [Homalodisca vitripennis]